jgi:hypothetical protein
MRKAHNKITIPPSKENVKKWLIEKFGDDFEPNFLDKIVNEYEDSVNRHNEYSKKKSLFYISKQILKFDRIYRKQERLYWLKRGWGEKEAEQKRVIRDKKWYIDKYGFDLGLEKINLKNTNISKNCGHTLEKFIQRYGEEFGNLKYNEYKKNCSRNLEFFIKKYGNEEGSKKFKKFKKHIGKASKESLLVFNPLVNWLSNDLSVDVNEIYYGDKNSREHFIVHDGKTYLYDFTIKTQKIIIEFNGVIFHVNENWSDEKKKTWKHPFKNINYIDAILNDNFKLDLAKKHGFKTLTIWSDTPIEENIETCKQFILNEIK